MTAGATPPRLVVVWAQRTFNHCEKMKTLKYLALALMAIGFVSCEDNFNEEPFTPDAEQEFVIKKITLNAQKGNDSEDTRVYVGSANSTSGTIYYWHETDKIGVFALNTGSTMKNYEAKINELNQGNKNLARFSSYLNYAPNNNENADLFIYWPYNSSNVVSDQSAAVTNYLKNTGVQIRTVSAQDQMVYGTQLGSLDHPSVNIAKYGAAYDMTTCDNTGAGSFELKHQTAYLQFNAWGVVGQAGSNDYGNGDFEVTKMTVRLGKVTGSVDNGTLQNGSTFTSVKIAGNFTYNVPTYNKGNVKASDVKLLKAGGDDFVSVTLAEPQQLLNTTKVPVFAVINAANITADNVNAIEATITLNRKNENGQVIGTYTRTRYISLGGNVIKGGDFYNISYKVNDPTEQNVALDIEGNSNCYIISYPGTYTFDVSFPGNGQLPFNTTYDALGLPESGKFFTEATASNYEVDWLWASGASFDAAGGVDGVVTVGMNAELGVLEVKPQGSSELNGNLVVALHRKNSTEIIWTWHIWFCRPVVQNYNFPNTRPTIPINNENWYMFDRNLGAETNELGEVTSYGLYYQLGRHVPFITPTKNGTWPSNAQTTYVNSYFGQSWGVGSMTLANVYSKPMTMNYGSTIGTSSGSNVYTYAWSTSDQPATDNSKTIFDPCPLGYKLPITREWDSFKNCEWEAAAPAAICSGVFGYGALYSSTPYTNYKKAATNWWENSIDMDSDENIEKYGDVAAIINARQSAGDYWESGSTGRTYTITAYAGTNSLTTPLKTYFPNTGKITPSSDSATSSNIGTNYALWAAGRIKEGEDGKYGTADDSYDKDWFGPKNGGDFVYSSLSWYCYVPWYGSRNVHNSPMGTDPYSIGGAVTNAAVPVRCIREYNSTATASN